MPKSVAKLSTNARGRFKERAIGVARVFAWVALVSGVATTICGFWSVRIASPHVQIWLNSGAATIWIHPTVASKLSTKFRSRFTRSFRVGDVLFELRDFEFYMEPWRLKYTKVGGFKALSVTFPPPVIALLGAVPLAFWIPNRRRRRRKREGRCLHCGYDLRFCPSNRCPECGESSGEILGETK